MKQFLVQCHNALYGMIVERLLYYRKFTNSLTDVWFKINPYNPCVANKMINGQQMTLCYHVYDCKLSHHWSKVNDRIIKWLRQEHESIIKDGLGKMTVIRGKVHKYLYMTLDYTVRGQVQITMIDFLDGVLITFEKAEPKGGATQTQVHHHRIYLRWTNI